MSKSLFKRIGTSVVALSLVISSLSAVTVSAEDSSDFHPSVTYAKGDYTFGKLSHPDKPVSTPDGIVDYLGSGNVAVTGENGATGQGDQGQSMLGLLLLTVTGCMWVPATRLWATR